MRPTLALVFVAAVVVTALAVGCPADAKAGPSLARPAPSAEPLAAHVLDVTGAVQVRAQGGAAFAAAPGLDLVESDTLEPQAGGAAILQLPNGHLVRVDDAGALAVRDLLLLRAPPTTRSVDEQLQAFVDATPDSQRAARERAAAWRQMRRAADTSRGVERSAPSSTPPPSPPPPSPLDQLRAAAESAPQAGAAAPEPPAAKASAEKQKAKREVAPGRAKADAKGGLALDDASKDDDGGGAGAAAPTFSAKRGKTAQTATPWPLPAALQAALVDVQACVAADLRATGLAVTTVDLRLHVVGDRVTRAGLSGGLPPPACVRALVGGSVGAGGDGVVVVTLPLP